MLYNDENCMDYFNIGDVVPVRGTVFKGNGKFDVMVNGHPAFILCKGKDKFYYLLIQWGKINHDNAYYSYYWKPRPNAEWRNCNVNLRDIYVRNAEFHQGCQDLTDEQKAELFDKFIYYQENIRQDNNYRNIEESVKEYRGSLSRKR